MGEAMKYSPDEVRRTMQQTRDNLERLRDLEVSPEPLLVEKEWSVRSGLRGNPSLVKLDTEPAAAAVAARLDAHLAVMAQILPAIEAFMKNVNEDRAAQQKKNKSLEQKLADTHKALGNVHQHLADQERSFDLQLRSVQLAHQNDMLTLGENLRDLRIKLDQANATNDQLCRTIASDRELVYGYGSQ